MRRVKLTSLKSFTNLLLSTSKTPIKAVNLPVRPERAAEVLPSIDTLTELNICVMPGHSHRQDKPVDMPTGLPWFL